MGLRAKIGFKILEREAAFEGDFGGLADDEITGEFGLDFR
jgi:hypothetical protein